MHPSDKIIDIGLALEFNQTLKFQNDFFKISKYGFSDNNELEFLLQKINKDNKINA
jgi:hypothetical protein